MPPSPVLLWNNKKNRAVWFSIHIRVYTVQTHQFHLTLKLYISLYMLFCILILLSSCLHLDYTHGRCHLAPRLIPAAVSNWSCDFIVSIVFYWLLYMLLIRSHLFLYCHSYWNKSRNQNLVFRWWPSLLQQVHCHYNTYAQGATRKVYRHCFVSWCEYIETPVYLYMRAGP